MSLLDIAQLVFIVAVVLVGLVFMLKVIKEER